MEDSALIAALKRRDADVFASVVDDWSPTLLSLARAIVRDGAVAEEIVQDAWLALLNGLDGFEGRASLKTWLCQIVVNRARTRVERDRRTTSVSDDADIEETFFNLDGNWLTPVKPWQLPPDRQLERSRAMAALTEALEALPENQRLVVTLRDIEGLSAEETCHALGLSETNHRQLLHRGRARLRQALAHLWES